MQNGQENHAQSARLQKINPCSLAWLKVVADA
jgi:hypothetical protein